MSLDLGLSAKVGSLVTADLTAISQGSGEVESLAGRGRGLASRPGAVE